MVAVEVAERNDIGRLAVVAAVDDTADPLVEIAVLIGSVDCGGIGAAEGPGLVFRTAGILHGIRLYGRPFIGILVEFLTVETNVIRTREFIVLDRFDTEGRGFLY